MRYCNKTSRYGKIRRFLYQEGLVIVFAPKAKKEEEWKFLYSRSFNSEFPLVSASLHRLLSSQKTLTSPHLVLHFAPFSSVSHLYPQVEMPRTLMLAELVWLKKASPVFLPPKSTDRLVAQHGLIGHLITQVSDLSHTVKRSTFNI